MRSSTAFPVLEAYGERIEDLEAEVVANPTRRRYKKIYHARQELLSLRHRAIGPNGMRLIACSETVSSSVTMCEFICGNCYDHAVQVIDMVETYRELTSG